MFLKLTYGLLKRKQTNNGSYGDMILKKNLICTNLFILFTTLRIKERKRQERTKIHSDPINQDPYSSSEKGEIGEQYRMPALPCVSVLRSSPGPLLLRSF